MAQNRKKKNCQKGYSCGFTCISITKMCLKEFPEGVSVSLENRSVLRSYPIEPKPKPKVQSSTEDSLIQLKKKLKQEEADWKKANIDPLIKERDEAGKEFSSLSESDEVQTIYKSIYGKKHTGGKIYLYDLGIIAKPSTYDEEKALEYFKDRFSDELYNNLKSRLNKTKTIQKEIYKKLDEEKELQEKNSQIYSDAKKDYKVERQKPSLETGELFSGKPHSNWKKKRDADLAVYRETLSKRFGADLVKAAEDNVRTLIDNSDLVVRANPSVIDKIREDGRLKNQFETGTSGGVVAKSERREVEKDSLGVSTSDPTLRPIYGYLTDRLSRVEDRDRADHYGDVIIKFKDEVKQRSTVTGGDTLDDHGDNGFGYRGSQIGKDFNIAAIFPFEADGQSGYAEKEMLEKIANAKSLADIIKANNSSYIETQLFGQPGLKDAAELIYTNGSKPTPDMEKWAKDNGVEIIIE